MHQGRLFPSWNLMDTGLASPSPTSWSAEVFFPFRAEIQMGSLGGWTY